MQVWELADGKTSLTQIAKKTELAVSTVQQIGFRLAAVGLVKEIALELAPVVLEEIVTNNQSIARIEVEKPALSKSFMSNLVGFLKKRV
jgi:DNA-binding IclR family transcriptional regulator